MITAATGAAIAGTSDLFTAAAAGKSGSRIGTEPDIAGPVWSRPAGCGRMTGRVGAP